MARWVRAGRIGAGTAGSRIDGLALQSRRVFREGAGIFRALKS